jgi:SSS family solute:Na+ symporter
MSGYDYGVVAIYLAFICSLGLVFRRFSKDSSDYFVGGGNVLWWLVGATAFMSQFSAWTFTGAAGKAYTDGLMVTVLFLGNAIGYFVAYRWSAAKYRQMRVVTPMEGVRDRFGRANEQFFTWIWLPIGILYAGIWLDSVSKFVSVVFGMNVQLTIVIVGFVVVFVAALGGAWAVVASDFMQMLILMAMSVFAAFLSVRAVGHGSFGEGLTSFVDRLPRNHLDWTALLRPQVVVLWVVAALLKQFCTTNNLNDSNRFLFSRDSRSAKQAALLASILFVVGPLLWFIPPMAAAILYPDLSVIPELKPLGSKIADGAYVAIGLRTMPKGMIGLMVSAIFAATMSNMDTGLNKNAGIFVRNFYKPILRSQASEREYLVVGKLVSVAFGALVVIAAVMFESIPNMGLFDVMMLFSSMIAIPYLIPLIWGIVIKRAPKWSAWSTVLVGFTVSLLTSKYLPAETVRKFIGLATPFRPQEVEDYKFFTSLFLNVSISSVWFLFTTLFARYNSAEYTAQEKQFFQRISTPVISRPEETRVMDRAQLRTLGIIGMPYGAFVMLLSLIPNPLSGRLGFILSGGIILFIASLLYRASRRIVIPAAAPVAEPASSIEAQPSA